MLSGVIVYGRFRECFDIVGLVLREEAGKPSRIFSASWARDEDISRYLKSLPNWLNLQEERTKGKKLVCS